MNIAHKLLYEIMKPRAELQMSEPHKKQADEELFKSTFNDLIERNLLFRDLKRTINTYKTYRNFRKNQTHLSNLPLSMFVEPTNICNLTCPSCPTGNNTLGREKGHMSLELFKNLMDEVGDHLVQLFFWNYGEPTLNPAYPEMLSYAKSKNIYIQMDTNGTTLNNYANCEKIVKTGLDRITISLDGVRNESYAAFRGKDFFETVKEGIKKLSETKKKLGVKTPFIELQFILMKTNEQEIEELLQLAKEIGVNEVTLRYFIFRQYDQVLLKALIDKYKPITNEYAIYQSCNGKIDYKRTIDPSCFKLYSSSCVFWNGEVVPCCYDAYSKVPLGNINDGGFLKVWNGERYRAFRETIFTDKSNFHLCMNCNSKENWVHQRIAL